MRKLKYDYVVGTGGIGSGILFRFSDNITLGRNESRLAELMDVRDFCKSTWEGLQSDRGKSA